MSRHNVTAHGKTYTYGYDNCVPEYYLMSIDDKGQREFLVGGMASFAGTASNLLQEFKRQKLLGIIHPEHITLAAMDLPIPQKEFV